MIVPERRLARLLALLLSVTLLAAACGDDEEEAAGDDPTTTEAEGTDTTAAEGTDTTEAEGTDTTAAEGGGGGEAGSVNISGSSTVEPISSAVAEAYAGQTDGFEFAVDGPGTGDGFELFCGGEIDVADASRAIEEEEVTACEEGGVEFVELTVAFDGISVIASPDSALECVTFEDLYAIIGPEAEGTVSSLADASELATELGSTTELPDAELELTGPGEESGTYDSFIELAFGDIAEARVEEGAITEDVAESTRADYEASPNDNVIIENVAGGGEGALGWVGFAFAEDAGDSLKELEVDGGEGCVAPSTETIADGSYPLSRPLFIYVSTTALDENPALEGFVDFYLNDGYTEGVESAGYVPLPDDLLEESRTRFTDRTTGAA